MSSGKRFKLLKYIQSTELAIFAVRRLLQDSDEYISHLNGLHGISEDRYQIWGQREEELERALQVDMHSVVCICYLLMKQVGGVRKLRTAFSETVIEDIELLRHHFEHWDDIERFYMMPEGVAAPFPKQKTAAARYIDKHGKGNPKLGMRITYTDQSHQRVSRIIFGQCLEPIDLLQMLDDLMTRIASELDLASDRNVS